MAIFGASAHPPQAPHMALTRPVVPPDGSFISGGHAGGRRRCGWRNRENPFCCGAGGGLLFADKEEEPGSRISDVRFKQLQDTGAGTVVTACPFCSIMLKGAQSSAQLGGQPGEGEQTHVVDL